MGVGCWVIMCLCWMKINNGLTYGNLILITMAALVPFFNLVVMIVSVIVMIVSSNLWTKKIF